MSKLPRPSCNRLSQFIFLAATFLFCAASSVVFAERVTLHLKGGDLVSGWIVSETNNVVVISNSWNGSLSVPLNEIGQREIYLASATNTASTNTLTRKQALVKADEAAAALTRTNQHWKGEAQVGLNLIYGAKKQQIFNGRFKLDYQQPYQSNPKEFFKNAFDYVVEYGKTDDKKSSDRMQATDKTSFDIYQRWYAYNLLGVGYDQIKKINLQYEAGPGVGYHLFTRPKFTMNTESGVDYQVQYRSGSDDSRDFFYRLAEDLSWKWGTRTTLTEKLELFPRVDLSEFRLGFETTLSYDLWKNIALNFTVLDRYDTQPGTGVEPNELQIRSSLGVKF
jgi:putative salt-induced outer membrane protein YdiY